MTMKCEILNLTSNRIHAILVNKKGQRVRRRIIRAGGQISIVILTHSVARIWWQ